MSEINEQIDVELSTDDLKSVSGGGLFINTFKGTNPQGSGSDETLKDWKKRNSWESPPINGPVTDSSTET
ncbi:hypothetical protein PMIT1327_01034 [Prochlorococcus marinus str. MIT 1327]|nr:hypothetical protein PMIT1312_00731 [Prochlorococcus marinus str. MIT 1312]KZR81524.1 hypothetical protein PMIT1327_01034 [Prochlorococcus marinus str. MIT 1327]